jgi:hypothetical protein
MLCVFDQVKPSGVLPWRPSLMGEMTMRKSLVAIAFGAACLFGATQALAVGMHIDPNGRPAQDSGDPTRLNEGSHLDPNGDRGSAIDPNGFR